MDEAKTRELLRELGEVCRKYGVTIGGCGCCGSPFVYYGAFEVANNLCVSEFHTSCMSIPSRECLRVDVEDDA